MSLIEAHGTGTVVGDQAEVETLKRVFGVAGAARQGCAIGSVKSMIGHTLGAAGAIEAAATVLTVHHGILPPTINHETADPEIDLDVVPNEAREVGIRAAISNAFGFGGQNGVLAFARV